MTHRINTSLTRVYTGAIFLVLTIQIRISVGLYYFLKNRAPAWSRLQLFMCLGIYLSIVITLFVFPFTTWDRNWANVSILGTFFAWMGSSTTGLWKYYRLRHDSRRQLVLFQIMTTCVFGVGIIVYFVLRFFPDYVSWLLISEIGNGLCILGYLVMTGMHLWRIVIEIKT